VIAEGIDHLFRISVAALHTSDMSDGTSPWLISGGSQKWFPVGPPGCTRVCAAAGISSKPERGVVTQVACV
jgi:hypothetical protein